MRLIALLLLALVAPRALAQPADEHPIDRRTDACLEADPTTRGMVECFEAAEAAWDAELNRLYRHVMDAMDPAARQALREAQRRWLTFRDAEFVSVRAFYGSMEGTMWQFVHAQARMDVVRGRALELGDYAWALDPEGP